ncbi:alpha/beta hydrolase [Microbacterium sp. UBA837]|uniref:alpha/beta hydrolase n=1 Tax=Microbacterium sp. UBA837 TaxID=1946956 RepID=UPI0025FDBFA1|nr:alpha/beta hydrolase [Microbacterium sp. UBA837]
MSMYGADVAQLRELGRRFEDAAARLEAGRMSVADAIQIKAWFGPAAIAFRYEWESAHSRRILDAAERLRTAAAVLHSNALEQERTSAVSAAGSGATARPRVDRPGSSLAAKWDAMTNEERRRLPLSQLTDVYSYAPSLPARVRDEANRIALERYSTMPCPAGPEAAVDRYRRMLVATEQVQAALREHPDAQLLVFDPGSGDSVHVAISLGDMDTADNVAVYTQGWTSRADKEGGLSDPLAQLAALRGHAGGETAMVLWMDYDAPQNQPSFGDVFGIANAQQTQYGEAGAGRLADFAEGIRGNNPDARITALGHSYGSYVTGLAAQQTDVFDAVVVFGSPGVGASSLDQLNVGPNFYVIEAPGDIIADSGQFGADPSSIRGARRIGADPMPQFFIAAHESYLREGSASQQGIADVVAGRR